MRCKKSKLVLMSIMIASLIGCNGNLSDDLNKFGDEDIKEPVSRIEYPTAVAFDDFNGKGAIRENNPVSEGYLKALHDFSTRSSLEVLNSQGRTDNIMYSPLSLYMALVLSASGANHQTQEEILSVLGMEKLGLKQLENQTGNLFRLLYTDNEIGKLAIANSLWLDQDILFKKEYIDTVSSHYYASLFNVDFDDKKTGDLMSKWIAQNTNGTLKPSYSVNPEQIMSIINTVYFYDEWINRFNENKTKKDIFYSYDGQKIKADFMNMTVFNSFTQGAGFVSTSLAFKNQGAMNFYLPDEGMDVYDLISTQEKVEALMNIGHPSNVSKYGEVVLGIPKFNYGSTIKLKEVLKIMGIKSAFEFGADFTNLTDESIAYISDIVQSTHVSIDEKGCEASAYTEMRFVGSAPPQDKAEIILNRPFIFTITSSNGVVLFMGIVINS